MEIINTPTEAYAQAKIKLEKLKKIYTRAIVCGIYWSMSAVNNLFGWIDIPGWVHLVFLILSMLSIFQLIKYVLPQLIFGQRWEAEKIKQILQNDYHG